MAKPPLNDDFDPVKSIQELSANLNQPDKFADIFCTAARSQKKIDVTLKEITKDTILADKGIKEYIQLIIREQNKTDFYVLLRKIAFSGWTIVVFLLGVIVTAICTAFANKYFS